MYHNYLRIISSLKSAAYIANKHPTIVFAMALSLISCCIYAGESPTNSVRDTVICPAYLSQPQQWKLLSPHTKSSDLKFANYPSKRNAAASWVDNSGSFYLFGGDSVPVYPFGTDSSEFSSTTADMWKYNPNTLAWTEILPARYNDPGNTNPTQGAIYPVARFSAMHWKAQNGKLMLFGGQTYELASQGSSAQGPHSVLNDLWSYDTTTNLWTQINDSSESPNKPSPAAALRFGRIQTVKSIYLVVPQQRQNRNPAILMTFGFTIRQLEHGHKFLRKLLPASEQLIRRIDP